MVHVLAFVDTRGAGVSARLWLIAGACVPALLAWLGGLWLMRFRRWKRTTGVLLVSTAVFSAFLVFTFVCLIFSPGMERYFPPSQTALFGRYWSGSLSIVITAAAGALLLRAKSG